MMLSFAISCLPFLTLVGHVASRPLQIRATIPADDPFYTPPAGFGASAPGTVLRSRQVDIAFSGARALTGYTAYQLLYRTTSANTTTPIATVTTVIQPVNATKDQLLSFATAEDSDNSKCAPSYNYQPNDPNLQTEQLYAISFLNEGLTLSIPDYEGPNSAFSAGRLAGHAVLDGLRAAINYAPLGFDKATVKVAAYGYSGGSIATGWAAALQPTYADDLSVVGWTFGGTPANISATLAHLDGGLFSGFGVAGVFGQLQAYQAIEQLLQRIATSAGQQAFSTVASECSDNNIINFAFKKFLSTHYQSDGDRLLYDPTVVSVVSTEVLGVDTNEVPTAPIFVYQALGDEVIPYANALQMVQSWCNQGIKSAIFTTNEGPSGHISEEILGFPSAQNFILDRFAGRPAAQGCVFNSTVLPLLSPAAASTGLQTVLGDLLTILTGQVGLDDGIYKAGLLTAAAAAGNTPASGAAQAASGGGAAGTASGTATVKATATASAKAGGSGGGLLGGVVSALGGL